MLAVHAQSLAKCGEAQSSDLQAFQSLEAAQISLEGGIVAGALDWSSARAEAHVTGESWVRAGPCTGVSLRGLIT